MKKMLLLAAALLMVTSAGAQLKSSASAQKPIAQMKEMLLRSPGTPAQPRLNANREAKPYYIRPAGAFAGYLAYDTSDPTTLNIFSHLVLAVKPYTDYTYRAVGDGVGTNANYSWYNFSAESLEQLSGRDATIRYGVSTEIDSYYAPILNVVDDGTTYYYYPGNDEPTMDDKEWACVLSALNIGSVEEDIELLVSSKTICTGGRWGDQQYPFTYYYGAQPYGDNDYGWWFGKNGTLNMTVGAPINGIAQAFEKPTAPYLLKNVALYVTNLNVAGPVQMTCKVYKLNGIPAYDESSMAMIDDFIGEQIATGIANLDASSADTGLINFTLYDVNGIRAITPEINDPILITIEDYNSAWMSNLTDFTALISTDYEVDEGYGELAYLKMGLTDDSYHFTGEFKWQGLNNLFNDGYGGFVTMKTGFSIFMTIDQPYIGFFNSLNPGEYTFPADGGMMVQRYDDESDPETSIWFDSSSPYSADVWSVTCDADWLSYYLFNSQLNDSQGNLFDYVNAYVWAQPLPEGTTYREATMRFSIPGAYIDYVFKQGEKSTVRGDVNGDGAVNIGDVTALIDILLSGATAPETADCDLDGNVNIADVTALIDYLLSGNWP